MVELVWELYFKFKSHQKKKKQWQEVSLCMIENCKDTSKLHRNSEYAQ